MSVLDASALLAWLRGEPGAEVVEQALLAGGICSAANWSEVAQKSYQRGADWRAAAQLLRAYGLAVEPVTSADAERAAALWLERADLSLADRLCLATAERLQMIAVTADRAWGASASTQQIRCAQA